MCVCMKRGVLCHSNIKRMYYYFVGASVKSSSRNYQEGGKLRETPSYLFLYTTIIDSNNEHIVYKTIHTYAYYFYYFDISVLIGLYWEYFFSQILFTHSKSRSATKFKKKEGNKKV